jgi:hypothetical protein
MVFGSFYFVFEFRKSFLLEGFLGGRFWVKSIMYTNHMHPPSHPISWKSFLEVSGSFWICGAETPAKGPETPVLHRRLRTW